MGKSVAKPSFLDCTEGKGVRRGEQASERKGAFTKQNSKNCRIEAGKARNGGHYKTHGGRCKREGREKGGSWGLKEEATKSLGRGANETKAERARPEVDNLKKWEWGRKRRSGRLRRGETIKKREVYVLMQTV